ncbi:MAG: tetratricopeptide repeat protein [Crocinitomicaceae bacterium]|nr:tetratricopeptide repeat protein [Crocinitomicaceae bacterium]
MRKFLLVAAMGLTTVVFAQKGNTSSAGIAYKNYEMNMMTGDYEAAAKELNDAKGFIDQSFVHDETKDDPKTLMYYGKIYIAIPQCAALTGDDKLTEVDGEKAFEDGFNALKRSKEIDTKGRYHQDVDDYCNLYRGQLSQIGVKMYEEEKWEEAMGALIGAAAFGEVMGFSDSVYYFYGGLAAWNVEKYDEASQAFAKTTEWGYQLNTSVYYYSQSLQKQGKTAEAEKMLKEQVAKHPGEKDILIEMINLYIDTDRKEEAVTALNDVIALDPNNVILIYTAGTVYENMDDFENAEKQYLRAIEIDGANVNALSALGGLYFNKGADLNNQANKLEFGDPNYDKMVADSKDYFSKSVPYLEKAVEASPKDVNLWIALRDAYGKAGNVEKFKEAKAKVQELSGE